MTADHLAHALSASGLSGEAVAAHAAQFERLLATLGRERTDHDEWDAWYVPGRIEVLGKHTDYGGGRSLICAAERGFSVVAAPRRDIRLSITDIGRGVSLQLDPAAPRPDVSWATYPMTVIKRVFHNFPEMTRGLDLVFESDLPSAAGMSSSSALMVAVLLALARVNRLDTTSRWREHGLDARENLAAYAATIENGTTFRGLVGEAGVGTEGGSEDHTAILCSRPGQLGQFSFVPTRHERYIPFPADLTFAIGVSGIAARKTGEARDDYNRASRNAARVLARWRERTGRADNSLAAAIQSSDDAPQQLRSWLADDSTLLDRFEQFLEESTQLVTAAGDQLAARDLDGFGRTVDRSQRLAEERLRNQVPETITLARLARDHGAFAASAFGAGFGGSVWALVSSSDAPVFLDQWQNAYRTAHPAAAPRARFFLTRPGPASRQARRQPTRRRPTHWSMRPMSEPNNNHPDRRTFLQVAGAVVGASVSGITSAAGQGTPAAAPQSAGASFAAPPIPEVRIGFVGVGGQGGVARQEHAGRAGREDHGGLRHRRRSRQADAEMGGRGGPERAGRFFARTTRFRAAVRDRRRRPGLQRDAVGMARAGRASRR